jgi:hypothetical protein
MRKKTAALVGALLLLGSFPASSLGAAPRTVTFEYQGANSMKDPEGNVYANWGIFTEAAPRKGERFVTVEVVDSSDRPVLFDVHQRNEVVASGICGTSERLALVTRKPVHVHLHLGPGCADMSVPTQGTVAISFER